MKGILFTPDNIKAIRDGLKVQTRRLDNLKEINQEPNRWIRAYPVPKENLLNTPFKGLWQFEDKDNNFRLIKPRYCIGEIVYVKEAWCPREDVEFNTPKAIHYMRYKLDSPDLTMEWHSYDKWRSPLFMPQWAARTFLRITAVRPERLQDITEEDARAEGCTGDWGMGCIGLFQKLWDSINGKRYPWSSNPFVWVYSFELTENKS